MSGVRECRCGSACECGGRVESCPQCDCLHCCGWQSSHHPQLAKALEDLERLPVTNSPMPDAPPEDPVVEDIRAYQGAARAIRRSVRSEAEMCVLLAKLADDARKHAAIPTAAQAAIWEEAEGLLWRRGVPEVPAEPVEAAIRSLRRQGLIRCRECRRELPEDATLDRWARLRRQALEDAVRREKAVSP